MPVLTNISCKVLLQSKYKYQIFSQTYHVVFRHEMILSCLVEVAGNTQKMEPKNYMQNPNIMMASYIIPLYAKYCSVSAFSSS